MNELAAKLDPTQRRAFLEKAAKGLLGVSLFPALDRAVAAAPVAPTALGGRAKRLIYLFMNGGMTHLDTFDLKPGHANQGETRGIATNVAGLQISQFLPELACNPPSIMMRDGNIAPFFNADCALPSTKLATRRASPVLA